MSQSLIEPFQGFCFAYRHKLVNERVQHNSKLKS